MFQDQEWLEDIVSLDLQQNSNHNYPIAPNILNQHFKVDRMNPFWVSNMTYVLTKEGWVYLTVIMDLFNREFVGWAMSDNLSTQANVVAAWNMAINKHKITRELVFHSDRGSQYAIYMFTSMIKKYDGLIKQSMSRKGNCWDNAIS